MPEHAVRFAYLAVQRPPSIREPHLPEIGERGCRSFYEARSGSEDAEVQSSNQISTPPP